MTEETRFARLVACAARARREDERRVLGVGDLGREVRELLSRQSVDLVETSRAASDPGGLLRELDREGGEEFVGIYYGHRLGDPGGEHGRLFSFFSRLLVPHGAFLWQGVSRERSMYAQGVLGEAGFEVIGADEYPNGTLVARKRHHCCTSGQSVLYDRLALGD